MSTPDKAISISPEELDAVLDRARNERWSELLILGPNSPDWYVENSTTNEGKAFHLRTSIDGLAKKLLPLTDLASLDLTGNVIGPEGGKALGALTNLTSLDLRDNEIGPEGAKALSALTNDTSLDLRDNEIGDEGTRALLDAWIDRPFADQLVFLSLKNKAGPQSVLPVELIETGDAQAILAAYRRYRAAAERQTLRSLNEAKVLVVGNEAVGKTSLIRYLVRNEPRDPAERKTPGAAIHEKIETQTWSPEGDDILLNVWDFGGQEVMRGTHRYFLTERSIYLLVLEDRREDDRSIDNWLKTIRNRGGTSPIIVVINKSDEGKQDLRLDKTGL